MSEQKPTIGRIVHFKLNEGTSKGQIRPALIVRVWNDTCVQLHLFLDKANDHSTNDFASSASLATDLEAECHGQWFWPPRS